MKIKKYLKDNSICISFIFVIVCFFTFMCLFCAKEFDYFWHIKAGEYMVNKNMILTKDVFSWFMKEKSWISHEWLFEVLLYRLKLIFPSLHVFVYVLVSGLTLGLILFFSNKKGYLKNIPFSLLWIIFPIIFFSFFVARPHMISNIFLAITIWTLKDLFYDENSKKLYVLPIISILWANFHGGSSSLIYLLIVVFLICGLFKFNLSKIEADRIGKKQIIKYILVMFLCIVCLCINPHGVKMLYYPYTNMADGFMQELIAEWHPTNWNNIFDYSYIVLLLVIFFAFLFSKKKIKLLDLVMFGIGTYMGIKSIRFWPYVYIFSTFFIFDYINKRKYDKGSLQVLCILGVFFLSFFFMNFNFMFRDVKLVDDEIIKILKDEKPKKLYNYYDFGGYLVYQDIEVFVDGRADLYTNYNLKDYYNIFSLSKDYVKLIDKYDFDYFLVPVDSRIATYLKYSDNYEKIISKEKIVLYKQKKTS